MKALASLPLPLRSGKRPTGRKSQQGIMLIIAMIALVALTLGGVAFMRSVDSGKLMAGNMAFSRASVAFTDLGMEAARAQLTLIAANAGCGVALGQCLWSDQAGAAAQANYWANWQPAFDYQTEASWAGALTIPSPMAGFNVRYIIHRMCQNTGDTVGNNCVLDPLPTAAGGGINKGSVDYGSNLNQGSGGAALPSPYYRITVRVDGPRNSLTYAQIWMV
jgi:type IV pilus assembly protein PilX